MMRTTILLTAALLVAGCTDDTAGGTDGVDNNNGVANNGRNNAANNGPANNGPANNGPGNNGPGNNGAASVAFTAPAAGDVVGGQVSLAVDVAADTAGVDYFVNGTLLAAGTTPGWGAVWDVSGLTSGRYTLSAIATTVSGASADVEIMVDVDTEPPMVALVAPGTIEVADTEIGYEASVVDNYGIAEVTVSVGDGVAEVIEEPWTGSVDVSALPAGEYELTVVATDVVGLVSADAKEFVVDRAPTVSFVTPEAEATVSGATEVRVDAADDVAIDRVELWVGGELEGEFRGGTFLWEPDFAIEFISLRAVAYDSRGQLAEAEIQVNVLPPVDYDFDRGLFSWISSMELELDGNVGADVDGDDQIDNSLGPLLDDLGNLVGGFDVNAQFGFGIQSGELALGIGWPGDLNTQNDTGVAVDIFDLDDTDDDPETHDAYYVNEASFLPGTQVPRTRFAGATVTGGTLEAGPAIFRLVLPFGPIALTIEIHRAVLGGSVAAHRDGIALRDGTLSGAVPWASLIAAINDFLSSPNCSCLGLDEDLIDAQARRCGAVDTSTCEAMGQQVCGTLAGACGLAVPVLAANLDIDLDGRDGVDAFSAYLHLGAEGTDVLGLAP